MNQTESMKQHRAEREAEQEIVNAKAASIGTAVRYNADLELQEPPAGGTR